MKQKKGALPVLTMPQKKFQTQQASIQIRLPILNKNPFILYKFWWYLEQNWQLKTSKELEEGI